MMRAVSFWMPFPDARLHSANARADADFGFECFYIVITDALI